MKTQIGNGGLNPCLFELPYEEYIAVLSQDFKRVLLPNKTDVEIDAELTKLYVENGGNITKPKAKKVAAPTAIDGGGDAEPAI